MDRPGSRADRDLAARPAREQGSPGQGLPGKVSAGQPRAGQLSAEVPAAGEACHDLTSLAGVRVEHIVSSDSPDPAVQAQDWDEWVLVVSGAAALDVDGERLELTAGSWVLLPAGTPHRVLQTAAGTHWIAVHGARQP